MNPADFIHVLPDNGNVLRSCLGDVISMMSTSKGRSWGVDRFEHCVKCLLVIPLDLEVITLLPSGGPLVGPP